ncbi:hypothetical protein IVB56_16630 [Bradyrhizobium sp. CW7]|uniref:hypothetical protein n=1 Tax=Bradyrhizobium sp. CW7 TaxID=2782688 RepID=UPI001FF8336A|nr:hypothetical protein [Bradyrhizobium sp. CW7]MCK1352671.1 hypothetical protein [Bradyrhizobium sp. CW7]
MPKRRKLSFDFLDAPAYGDGRFYARSLSQARIRPVRNLIGAGSTQALPHHGVEHKQADGDRDSEQWENVVMQRSKTLKY